MNFKYGMLDKKISKICVFNEEAEPPRELAIHRTSNCVIYRTVPHKRTGINAKCGFQSEIGKAFKPLGQVRQVTPIYQKITKNFFNEAYAHETIFLKDDAKNLLLLKKIQEKTQKVRSKLKNLNAIKDPHYGNIKTQIENTSVRLRYSKAGKSLDNSTLRKEISESLIDEGASHRQSAFRKKLIESARNLSFEQKLEFYEENPVIAERRIKTGHLPWDGPFLPSLPGTPENSTYFTEAKVSNHNTIKAMRRPTLVATMNLAFLKNPKLLGKRGGKILFQIMSDEKNNVKTSSTEIEELNKIISKRMKLLRDKETGWEQEVMRYAVDKATLQPTVKATNLINSYFSLQQ